MLQPLTRRTWAPEGKTPYPLRRAYPPEHLSVISALSISPERSHLQLSFSVQEDNIIAEDVLGFVKGIKKRIQNKIILILDKWSIHRAKILREYLQNTDGVIKVEWLPSYAPELNPVEAVWCHTKWGELKNRAPHSVEELTVLVQDSLSKKRIQQDLLRSFFKKSGLVL